MTSVGETLRRERLRTGLDLHKVAEDTKISVRMLELIEADQFDKLPGGVFARSFVGQYARALGLDADDHPDRGFGVLGRGRILQAAAAEEEGCRAGDGDDGDQGEREHGAGAPVHRSATQDAPAPVPIVPVPVLPGACRGVPSAQRGQVAGPGWYVGRSSCQSERRG